MKHGENAGHSATKKTTLEREAEQSVIHDHTLLLTEGHHGSGS